MENISHDHKTCDCGYCPKHTNNKALLVNVDRLKAESYIDLNVSEKMLRRVCFDIQYMIIENVTGTCLFNRLRDMVIDDCFDCDCNNCYKELIDVYLFNIFVHAVPAELAIPLSYQNRNNGVIMPTVENGTNTQLSEIKYLNQYYINKTDVDITRAINYLKCNRECFPELCCCQCSWCIQAPLKKNPTTPLNLRLIPNKKYL